MELRMKKSSMKTAPKGRMPPTRMQKTDDMYHGCCGIARGMAFVRVGFSSTGRL